MGGDANRSLPGTPMFVKVVKETEIIEKARREGRTEDPGSGYCADIVGLRPQPTGGNHS